MIFSIVNMGLSDEYGSWNTGCTRWRNSRCSSRESAKTSLPSKRTVPLVGSIAFSSMRAVVVLPEPDSPTIETVVPRGTESVTSSTARNGSCRPRTLNSFVTPSNSTIASVAVDASAPSVLPMKSSGRSRAIATDGAALTSDCV